MKTQHAFILFILFILLCATSASAIQFTAVDVGTLVADDFSDSGLVVGRNLGVLAIWNIHTMHQTTLSSEQYTLGEGINDLGEVCGESGHYGFRWAQGDVEEIRAGGTYTSTDDINNLGQVAGTTWYYDYPTINYERAFLWENGVTTLLDPLDGEESSTAVAIDSSGRVIGNSGRHGVVWQDGVPLPLPLLPVWTFSGISAASEDGRWIVGGVSNDTTHSRAIWHDGVMQTFELPDTIGNHAYHIASVTNEGVVFGFAEDIFEGHTMSPFVWTQVDGYADLNACIPGGTNGWTLTEVYAVNNHNQVLVKGRIDAAGRTFLLNPIPEPPGILALGSGLFGLVAVLRRRPAC